MKRLLVGLIVGVMLLGTVAPIVAQDVGTPVSAGTPVTLLGNEGVAYGSITVNAVTDPFEAYDPNSAPERGSRYVLLSVTVANDGPRLLSFNPYSIVLRDADGFIYQQAFFSRTDSATQPDLGSAEIPPGEQTSGVIGFTVLGGVPIEQAIYTGSQGFQMVVIADLGTITAPPVVGPDALVSLLGPDGAPMGSIAVTEMTDPWLEYDPNAPPQVGYRYVLLRFDVTNSSPRLLSFDPYSIALRDTNGFVYDNANIFDGGTLTVPVLEYQDIAVDGTVTGVMGFQVPVGATLAQAIFRGSSDRMVYLADLAGSGGTATPVASPAA